MYLRESYLQKRMTTTVQTTEDKNVFWRQKSSHCLQRWEETTNPKLK